MPVLSRAGFLFFCLSNKKAPPKAELLREEHIQESVLVSTLKRRSALLTQIQLKGGESDVSPCLVALSTGTVTVGPQRRKGITCSRMGALLARRVVRLCVVRRRVDRAVGNGGGAIGGIGAPNR